MLLCGPLQKKIMDENLRHIWWITQLSLSKMNSNYCGKNHFQTGDKFVRDLKGCHFITIQLTQPLKQSSTYTKLIDKQ
jgi:hypothetical protein